MRLDCVYARFFRSLNYDYVRQSDRRYKPDPWDETPSGADHPFVRVRLEPDITTIVGANESGKSQMLGAVKAGLSGNEIERRDFCRYSSFFATDDVLTDPEFGLRFCDLGSDERSAASEMTGVTIAEDVEHLALFRMNASPKLRVYVRAREGDWSEAINVKKPSVLESLGVPAYFEIDAKVPLPDAVPLDYLARENERERPLAHGAVSGIGKFLESLAGKMDTADKVRSSADELVAAYADLPRATEEDLKAYALGDDLLVKISGLNRELFRELRKAALKDDSGYADAIVDTVNDALARRLNFPHWWSQDTNFQLHVELRNDALWFLIKDRTGMSYSFAERSEGLKYFLSYFVQYLAHEPHESRPEILLMDEPDAFLSASGQQDLLRVFDAFAHPEDDRPPVQVIYATHSPFLIDKNRAERIRVLEKGEYDEGTRVVANASSNHYEPLRSALGSFVGETTFIGTCNLLLEGVSDQILLAGMSSHLERELSSLQRLDLNRVTLVPCSGAQNVPYMAYLARGRDVDRPSVIVLLDGDEEGERAREVLKVGGPREEELVPAKFVLLLSDISALLATDNPPGPSDIEDLVPLGLCVEAVRIYAAEFAPDWNLDGFSPDASQVFTAARATVKGLEHALKEHLEHPGAHLDKIGFARGVLSAVRACDDRALLDQLASNFSALLEEIARRQRAADKEANQEKIASRINRARRRFLANNPTRAKHENVLLLIEEIEGQLDASLEADEVRAEMRRWEREMGLSQDPSRDIEDYSAFSTSLQGLAYAGTRSVQSIRTRTPDDGAGAEANAPA